MEKLKLALLGFGNAGQAFCRLLLEKQEKIRDTYKTDVTVTAIATASKGNIYDPKGIDLEAALDDVCASGRFSEKHSLTQRSTMELAQQADYDVLIEMTPLNIFTGQPAADHIKTAFSRKKHAITANKGPVAWFFRELAAMAREEGVCFFYETTVMDGTPVFNLAEHTLKMAEVTEVSGILNSTTNFILEGLALGADYDDIMERGRSLGFIEADPAMDIEGYDAAAKITALLNVLMDAGITPDQVKRKGIEDITVNDIKDAASRGKVIKLLCRGVRKDDGSVEATVGPVEVSKDDILAGINSTTSIVSITTDLMKKVSIIEHEPEIEQTAYGVFGDLLRVLDYMSVRV